MSKLSRFRRIWTRAAAGFAAAAAICAAGALILPSFLSVTESEIGKFAIELLTRQIEDIVLALRENYEEKR